jgi:hypothetical protein
MELEEYRAGLDPWLDDHEADLSPPSVGTARSAVAGAEEDGSTAAAAMAKAVAGRSVRLVPRHAQQVLAGMGFTAEQAFHGHLRRALVLDELLGGSSQLTRRLGQELLRTGRLPSPLPLEGAFLGVVTPAEIASQSWPAAFLRDEFHAAARSGDGVVAGTEPDPLIALHGGLPCAPLTLDRRRVTVHVVAPYAQVVEAELRPHAVL